MLLIFQISARLFYNAPLFRYKNSVSVFNKMVITTSTVEATATARISDRADQSLMFTKSLALHKYKLNIL